MRDALPRILPNRAAVNRVRRALARVAVELAAAGVEPEVAVVVTKDGFTVELSRRYSGAEVAQVLAKLLPGWKP
jgi:hypothetical protein